MPSVFSAVKQAPPLELDVATLYRVLQLRVDVFVVEQKCPYPELDGRDLEPSARWFWVERDDGEVVATLRLLTGSDGTYRIGRVATAASARSDGLAGQLMNAALSYVGDAPIGLDAQSHLEGWYARFGFVRSGEEYIEDGIPHVPMSR